MTREELLNLTKEREGKLSFPFVAIVKYSRQAVPIRYGMKTREEADEFALDKRVRNPYVRWTEVRQAK